VAIFDGIEQIEDVLNQIDPLKELGIPVHYHIKTPSYDIKI
jgi:translation initiation factor 2 alpha subunit (eIF-2alpha)